MQQLLLQAPSCDVAFVPTLGRFALAQELMCGPFTPHERKAPSVECLFACICNEKFFCWLSMNSCQTIFCEYARALLVNEKKAVKHIAFSAVIITLVLVV